jgi:Flp pilus assembly protein TadG
MRKLRKFLTEEQGDILILFALSLVFLVGMVALATDIGLLAIKRAQLMEVGQIVRDARLEQTQLIWDANNPTQTFDQYVREYGIKNGLNSGQIETKYEVVDNTATRRESKVTIILHDTYQCTTLRLFGFNQIPINVTINGSAYEYNSNGVWSP